MDKQQLSQMELQSMFYSDLTPMKLAKFLRDKTHVAIDSAFKQMEDGAKELLPEYQEYHPEECKDKIENLKSIYLSSFDDALQKTFEEIESIAAVASNLDIANLELPSEAEQDELVMKVAEARAELARGKRFNAELKHELDEYEKLEPVITHAEKIMEICDEVEKYEVTNEFKQQMQTALKGRGKDVMKSIE